MTLPPRAALQRTLMSVTETLAAELSCPSQHQPEWSEFEWSVARAVAAMHGVSPLLATRLKWRGPLEWVRFLNDQKRHTVNRHARIVQLLGRLDAGARAAGVAAVALKGAALHALAVYLAGERPMADVDLLVRPQEAARAAAMLQSLGFEETEVTWKERVFTPLDAHRAADLGEHSHNDLKIELHDRICEKLPWRTTDLSEHVVPGSMQPGLNDYPCVASLMLHLLFHAAGSMVTHALRLIHLNDLAGLAPRLTGADWDRLLEFNARRTLWWASPPLDLMSRYFPGRVPERVLRVLRRECPWALRRLLRSRSLTELSYSNLRIAVFPGIEWARSVPEALAYARSRLLPTAQHLAQRRHALTAQAWTSRSDWAESSQRRRVLRWIISKPARTVTLHAVRAALEQTHAA